MIYVDDAKISYKRWKMSHLCCIPFDLGELVEFGEKIGLKEVWIHNDHFDITQTKRALAIEAGATQVTFEELALMMGQDRRNR